MIMMSIHHEQSRVVTTTDGIKLLDSEQYKLHIVVKYQTCHVKFRLLK